MVYVINPVRHIPLLCVQWKTLHDEQRNSPKHVEFYSKNKFEKLVHVVRFIIRIITMHGHVNVKSLAMSVEGRALSRDWKWNNSNKRSGNTNKKSCNKNFANRKVEIEIIWTIWRECRPHHISMLSAGKKTIHRDMIRVCDQHHFNICKEIGVKLNNEHWYFHLPKPVKTSHECKITVLWNQQRKVTAISNN